VLDNLKEGVLVQDIYEPALNPLYRDVLVHYGAVALLCRIQVPDRFPSLSGWAKQSALPRQEQEDHESPR